MALRTNADGFQLVAAHKRLAAAVLIQAMDAARFLQKQGWRKASGGMVRDLETIRKSIKVSAYCRAKRIVSLQDPVKFLRAPSCWHDALDVEPAAMTDKVIYGEEDARTGVGIFARGRR